MSRPNTYTIGALFGGVSQQSDLVRSPDQLEAQTNGFSGIATGVSKRPPSQLVAKLMADAPANAFVHAINRDVSEQYIAIIADGVIRVFDVLTGEERTVNAPAGWGYLTGVSDYGADFDAVTVADYTFITNRQKTCAMAALGADVSPDESYQIWLNRNIGTDQNGVGYAPGSAYQYQANPVLGAFKGTVQRFDKLPPTNTEGDVWQVRGDDSSDFISYYVCFRGGTWQECVKPGLVNAINPTTMPHALISEANGTFTFAPFSWAPRRLGDEASNPNPGFIGRSIQRVLLYQNRLAFLYDESVGMSEAGQFGNFWRMSQRDYLDSDAIETTATSTKVAKLHDAVAHADGIFMTSDQTQFSLSNGELGLTAASIAIRPTTNYTVNTKAGLTACGSEIYFAVERSGHASVREYTRLSGSDATSAADVTAHVPTYIPGGVHALVAADDLNTIFVLTQGSPESIFVYQFYWTSADEKAQSAWHRWSFGTGAAIVAATYLQGFLYLVIKRGDGLWLEKVDLQAGAHPANVDHDIFLDRRATVQGELSETAQRTHFVLPFKPNKDRFRMVRTNAFSGRAETLIDPITYEWVSDTEVRVPTSEIAGPVIVGEAYEFELVFSKPFVRNGRGEAITSGRTQLRSFTVNYSGSAYFKVAVAPYGVDENVEDIIPAKLAEMTGRTLGAASLKLNAPAYHTGSYRFLVMGQNTAARIRLVNDSHVGSTFVSAEWEALYYNRARA
ncbi:hypothetical protein E4M02_04275 [Brevundimonas sp. S30B]|uniref:phage nozzle protein n=1 Tax=unclassified Brevundimonas TaxID=2622653 RepID=UPI0010721CF9|nr:MULTISPECIES: hypothetical protein [unclassified Brevundimonas]QBX36911.1 hypothetical protein E4M01_03540 [Brevundimonas sp. MF30-B]TFW04294.1 hypothetical protein E4M02_04275 [Brevundimonas sp. S30B]